MTGAGQALTIDQEVIATLDLIASAIDVTREWAELEVAGGKPPKWVIRELNIALGKIAAAARGEDTTP